MAAGVLVATSCSDFNDYNEVPEAPTASAASTLWDYISSNSQLSSFRDLVARTGYQSYLQQPRAYTIWAPTNLDMAKYANMSDSLLLEQFVKNHIAEYNYVASGDLDNQRVLMLNGKSFNFTGNGSYQFAGVDVTQANVPCSNGIMHILGSEVPFYPNLYEYLDQGTEIDSIRNYIKRYEVTTLDVSSSEKGPIVNGVQTYIDSVMVTTNSILGRSGLNANLQNEDSVYTMLLPTNKAYKDFYTRVKSLYNYIAATQVEMPTEYTKASDKKQQTVTLAAPAYRSDSLARKELLSNLVFSHSNTYNARVFGDLEKDPAMEDTLVSTNRTKLSTPYEIIDRYLVDEPVVMSNGFARVVDSLAFPSWDSFNPQITSLMTRNLLKTFASNVTSVQVQDPTGSVLGPEYTTFRYTLIENEKDVSLPDMMVSLPDVLSATYNVYCVVLPYVVGRAGVNKITPMNFSLSYTDASNMIQTYNFSSNPSDNNPKTLNLTTAFMNDTLKTNVADTIKLGTFTFPICYKGLASSSENIAPHIRVTSPIPAIDLIRKTTPYSREFRIWGFILRPVEYDDYLNSLKSNDNE